MNYRGPWCFTGPCEVECNSFSRGLLSPWGRQQITRAGRLLDEVLESLQSGGTHLLARGLRRNGDRLFGEGIDALALLGGRLLHDAKLDQARDDKFSRSPTPRELLTNDVRQCVENAPDALLVEFRRIANLRDDLGLGESLASHALPPVR